ncbi:MAG: rhomboid family intramembrane serine protease [Acidimicrobiales bacterium]
MHQASVGVHCPECVSGSQQQVYTARTMPGAQGTVTRALVGLNVGIWVISIFALGATAGDAGNVWTDYGTWGPPIDVNNEWWRIISGGFLHSGIIHLGFNMYILWALGQQLERRMGEVPYLASYLTALIGGSFGALILSPEARTVGASGAVFGLFGLATMAYRSRGVSIFSTGLGTILVLNLLFSFTAGVSLGGHLGGFLAGLALGALHFGVTPHGRPPFGSNKAVTLGVNVGFAAVLFVASILAASTWMSPLL